MSINKGALLSRIQKFSSEDPDLFEVLRALLLDAGESGVISADGKQQQIKYPLAVTLGGTGGTTPEQARENLGVVIAEAPETFSPGDYKWAAYENPDPGWLKCDGAQYSTTAKPRLFAKIGHKYGGIGNVFNVPNVKGKTMYNFDSGDALFDSLGESGGVKEVTLTTAQIEAHTHTGSTSAAGRHSHGGSTNSTGRHRHSGRTSSDTHNHEYGRRRSGSRDTQRGSDWSRYSGIEDRDTDSDTHSHSFTTDYESAHSHTVSTDTEPDHSHTMSLDETGGGEAHTNMPPYIVANCFIKE